MGLYDEVKQSCYDREHILIGPLGSQSLPRASHIRQISGHPKLFGEIDQQHAGFH